MGSMPRFAPGSLVNRKFAMDVDPEVVIVSQDQPAIQGSSSEQGPSTPRPIAGWKRKAGDGDGSQPEVQSKLRPRT